MSGEEGSDRVLLSISQALLVALALVLPGCAVDGSSVPQPPVEQLAQQLGRGGAASVIVLVSDHGRNYLATAGIRPPSAGDDGNRVGVGARWNSCGTTARRDGTALSERGVDSPLVAVARDSPPRDRSAVSRAAP
jgi:hypothetical protein